MQKHIRDGHAVHAFKLVLQRANFFPGLPGFSTAALLVPAVVQTPGPRHVVGCACVKNHFPLGSYVVDLCSGHGSRCDHGWSTEHILM